MNIEHMRQTVHYTTICNSPTYNRIPKELNILWYLHTKYFNIQSIVSISCGRAVELCAKDTREATKYGCGDGFLCGKTYNTQLSSPWEIDIHQFDRTSLKAVQNFFTEKYHTLYVVIYLYIYINAFARIYCFAGEVLLTSRIPLYYRRRRTYVSFTKI